MDAHNADHVFFLAGHGSVLGGAIGAAVTITQADSSTVTGTIVGDAAAPTYVLGFSAVEYAKLAEAQLTTAATVKLA